MHFMPDNSYFQHKGFQSPFSGGVEGGHSPSSMPNTGGGGEGGLGEPRVHRIPIQVETRGGATTATNPVPMGYSKSASSSSPTPSAGGGGGSHHYVSSQGAGPSQSSNFQPQQHHPQHPQQQHPQQQHPQPNPFISATSTSSSPFDSRPAAGGRNIEIPIQIAKSSSSPPAPSKKVDSSFQGAANSAAAVNESASDPAIADPNQVYAMGYEPLAGGNSAANSNNAEKQKNEGGKKETPFDYVKEVLDDLKNYESQVEEFSCASSSDKGYRYLDEMLTLCILRLDCINIDGNDELRKYRKSAINEVNRVAAILESKVSKTESNSVEKTPSQQNDSQGQQQQCSSGDAAMTQSNGSAAPLKPEDSQTSAAVAAEQTAAEPKNKKEAKKLEKAKAKKEKEEKEKEKEKAKKEAAAAAGEKKEGRRIILFRGKNKNKAAAVAAPSGDEAAGAFASSAVPGSAEAMDLDTNNNDLKDGKDGGSTAGGNSSDQASETASTSTTSSTTTLQGKETAV